MARITNVHPGHGKAGDQVTITVQFDTQTDVETLHVAHVTFFDDQNSPQIRADGDKENFTLRIAASVPQNAVTGPIEVDVLGLPKISTQQEFTVEGARQQPLTINRISPATQPYKRGSRIVFTLSEDFLPQNMRVYFPRTTNGPAILQALNKQVAGSRCTVVIPRGTADSGRVKLVVGNDSVLTRVITFTSE